MSQLPLFGSDSDLPPQAARLAPKLCRLADEGIYFGTSSWKYEGWLGSIYTPEKYAVRGKFSTRKFEQECLREYALTFPVVGGDFSFYQFPSPDYWSRLFDESPASLLFALKVPEDITVAVWPGHARYGKRAGQVNEHFLDARALERAFLQPLRAYRERVCVLMFEFGTFAKKVFPTCGDFLERLEPFLAGLSDEFRYGIEIRNTEYLNPQYFDTLSRHKTAHVFNCWTRMPELAVQIEKPGAVTTDFTVVRALLSRGRTYEQAVKTFEPYKEVQEPDPRAREAMARLCQQSRQRKKPAFLLVNNRLEGNAPSTIEGVADALLS